MHKKNQYPACHVVSHENNQDSKRISSSEHSISLAKRDHVLKLTSSFIIFKGNTKYFPQMNLGVKIPNHCPVRINDKKKTHTPNIVTLSLFFPIPSFKTCNM